ncbi:ABC transporter ATP-binding protein [Paraoerskovia sediminicola]|uniref:ABC transporter ATP-binding protein n=1 Tax=Paraoerskovia sediminicola TaxID=1138587 RepID=A0ABM8G3W6_9CELL|nr:ATP-binding cassette domain-containing protein [Paraoerskovia sediminicola]BDZ42725.1 ABC transporter ATP-binding protein [Paraoerskovia sediminicola]
MAVLELDDLSKSYGAVRALRSTSFQVRAGEIFGFVGSNGAGKTTTMRITLGVLTPDTGEVRWAGRPIDHATRSRIGYMPEERGLYPKMKVGEQLTYLARLHGLGAAQARSSMERWTETLGVDGRRDDEVQKLSLGNQQRVQLAAALVHEPDILVLDEPFSGLDPVAVDVMSGVLRDRARAGVPVIFSSHQLELVEAISDRVGIIKDGSMVAVGGIDELRQVGAPRWAVTTAVTTPVTTAGDDDTAWVSDLPGVRAVGSEQVRRAGGAATRVEFETTHEGSEQAVLARATSRGRVEHFGRVTPTLTELYRDVVSAEGSDDSPDDTDGDEATTEVTS